MTSSKINRKNFQELIEQVLIFPLSSRKIFDRTTKIFMFKSRGFQKM